MRNIESKYSKISQKKVAFVSGASRGIGRAIAEALAYEGYNLSICCSRSEDELNMLSEYLKDTYSVEVLTFVTDISDAEAVHEMTEATLAHFGQMDLVVNNAGIAHIGLLTDMTVDEWDNMIQTNLSSAFYVTRGFIPAMVRRKSGRIINISSMWGTVGASCEVAYSAAKGGLNSFTRALAKELAPSEIAVNAIACGVIDTSMNDCLTEEDKEVLKEEIPAGRMASPDEVAEAVIALTQASPYLTGQIIGLDGGYI